VNNEAISSNQILTSDNQSFLSEHGGWLKHKDKEFISFWERQISIEENLQKNNRKDIWTIPTVVREQMGTCISSLRIVGYQSFPGARFSSQYKLSKIIPDSLGSQTSQCSICDTSFSEGDLIIISKQNAFHPVAVGFIVAVSSNSVTVLTDKELDYEPENFNSETYKIDRDQFSSGMAPLRGSLYSLFVGEHSRLRELIVDLKSPTFSPVPAEILDSIKTNLNEDQQKAILAALSCM
jgi:hypothetical protein